MGKVQQKFPIVKPAASAETTFAAALAEGLAIQHRFRPEPIFAKTGVGFMRSEGVSEMAAAKMKTKRATPSK